MASAVDNAWFNGVPLRPIDEEEVAARRARLAATERQDGLDMGRLLEADLADDATARAVFEELKPTHVVHAAALSRVDVARSDPALAMRANLELTNTMLHTAAAVGGVRRFVQLSSSMVYGHFDSLVAAETHPRRPVEPYGASKLACEVLADAWGRREGIETVNVRPSAVYGPGDFNGRVTQKFVDAAVEGAPIVLFEGGRERLDFTFVEDAARFLALAVLEPAAANETFNLSGNDTRTLLELGELVHGYVPNAVLQLKDAQSDRPRRGSLDTTKAATRLGYQPRVSVEEGIRRMLLARGAAVPDKPAARRSPPPFIDLARPSVREEELRAVHRTLRSGWLTAGPENHAFEEELAAYVGMPHAVSVNSGASALMAALMAADIHGEVIVPAFTFPATANAVVLAGATPVFVDVEPERLGLDPEATAAAITPRTEAIVPVHIAGLPCRIDRVAQIAEQHGLFLLEDMAQALGARQDDRRLGAFGAAAACSFFPTKNLTTCEGGMVLLRDAVMQRRARALVAHGITLGTSERRAERRPWERRLSTVGFNLRMSAPQAAMGRVQLGRLDEMNQARRRLAAELREALSDTPLELPREPAGTHAVYHMFLARVPEDLDRDELVLAIRAQGVEATVHYDLPVPAEAPYRERGHWRPEAFPVAQDITRRVLTLPMHPELQPRELARVSEVVHLAIDQLAAERR